MKWGHQEKKLPWNYMTIAVAARYGHLKCLQYAHNNGCPWNEETCEYAAQNGHFLIACNMPMKMAAHGAYKHVFGLLVEVTCIVCNMPMDENGCPYDQGTEYAHEHDCPWDEDTCTAATKSGHLEVFRYAHDNHCSWFTGAANRGHLGVLRYGQ
jgi:hypothetical protein